MLFRSAPFLQTVNRRMAVALNEFCVSSASVIGLLVMTDTGTDEIIDLHDRILGKPIGTKRLRLATRLQTPAHPLRSAGANIHLGLLQLACARICHRRLVTPS